MCRFSVGIEHHMWSLSLNECCASPIHVIDREIESDTRRDPGVPTILRIGVCSDLYVRILWLMPSANHVVEHSVKRICTIRVAPDVWVFVAICRELRKYGAGASFPGGYVAPVRRVYAENYAGAPAALWSILGRWRATAPPQANHRAVWLD